MRAWLRHIGTPPGWLLPALAAFIPVALAGCRPASRSLAPASQSVASRADRADRSQAQRLYADGCSARRKNRLDVACRKLSQAARLAPFDGRIHHALGLALYESGKLRDAAAELETAARLLRDRAEPCYNLGVLFEAAGKYELAMQAYERALARQNDHLFAQENLARVRMRAGLHDRHTARLLEACLVREDRPDWVVWLRQQMQQLNRLPEIAQGGIP